jgi:hypothetical protein
MSTDRFDDDVVDVRLREALRRAVAPPPTDDVDWIGLHARITAAAGALNSTPVPTRAWWQPLAGWSPRGIPLAAAASVLLMLAADALTQEATPGAAPAVERFHTVEEELAWAAGGGSGELLQGLERDGMLDVALFYEEW